MEAWSAWPSTTLVVSVAVCSSCQRLPIAIACADDCDWSRAVQHDATRDAAEERSADCSVSAPAHDDKLVVELVGARADRVRRVAQGDARASLDARARRTLHGGRCDLLGALGRLELERQWRRRPTEEAGMPPGDDDVE